MSLFLHRALCRDADNDPTIIHSYIILISFFEVQKHISSALILRFPGKLVHNENSRVSRDPPFLLRHLSNVPKSSVTQFKHRTPSTNMLINYLVRPESTPESSSQRYSNYRGKGTTKGSAKEETPKVSCD